MSDFHALLKDEDTDSTGNETGVKISNVVDELASNSERQVWSVFATGEFDGATVKLQFGPTASGPWLEDDQVTFTAAGSAVTTLSRNTWVRGNVSSAGASTSVSLYVG